MMIIKMKILNTTIKKKNNVHHHVDIPIKKRIVRIYNDLSAWGER